MNYFEACFYGFYWLDPKVSFLNGESHIKESQGYL